MALFGTLKRSVVPITRYDVLIRNKTSRRSKEPVEIPKGKRITQPWNERKGVWKSTFSFLEIKTDFFGPDLIRKLQTPLDFSPKNIKKFCDTTVEDQEEANQSFIQERYDILGADLSAAHFVVHRGGAVRFYNETEWVRKKEDGSYILPSNFVPGLYVEAIDLNGMNLRTTGLENLLDLSKLRWLSLANNPLVDDWTLDSISGSYGENLQYLDLSNCPKVSFRGLYCFYRFQKLDTLVVNGISDSPEFKLACMMLEEIRPLLTIKGIDYSIPKDDGNIDSTRESSQETT